MALVFMLALAVRLVYWQVPVIQFKPRVTSDLVIGGVCQTPDSALYYKLTQNLLSGVGFRVMHDNEDFTMFVGPGYPLFVAAVLRLAGGSGGAVLLAQCLLDSGTAVLVFVLGLLLVQNVRAALLGGLAYALYYPNVIYTVWILTETLFTFVVIASLVLLCSAWRSRRSWSLAASGALFGFACLIRPSPIYFLPVAALFVVLAPPRELRSVALAMLWLGTSVAVQAPWLVQGPLHYGRFVLGSTGGGQVLLAGVSVDYDGDWDTQVQTNSPLQAIRQSDLPKHRQDLEFQRLAREELRRNLRERPTAALVLMARQVSRFYLNIPFRRPQSAKSYALAALNSLVLMLGLAGIWRARRTPAVLFLAAFLLYYTALHSVVNSLARYSAPLMPLWLTLAALAVESFLPEHIWSRGDPAAAATGWSRLQGAPTAARPAGDTRAG